MKRILLGLLLITFSVTLFAKKVELQDARAIALNAYYEKINMYYEKVDFNKLIIADHFVINNDGAAVYYIFNFTNNGFIIVSAEDAMTPILGYSFISSYSQENSSENFIGWMNGRAGAIKYLRENNIEATNEILTQWNELYKFDHTSFVGKDYGENVEPLLTCPWGQGSPYNYLCPVNTSGQKPVVGCVATAMSQIMFYWRYPEQGSGSVSYYQYQYGTISANFGETTYDWDGMLDDPVQINIPVALISFHAGVAVHMQYGTNSSGANGAVVDDAFRNYFNYSSSCYKIDHQGISQTTWENYIKDELDDACPVNYLGFEAGGGGHSFICDGYHSDNTYHFDFGWDGIDNGWYSLTNPNGFTQDQSIIINIFPDDASYPYGCSAGTEKTNLVGSFEDGSGPQENYDPNANCSWLINPQTPQDSVTNIKLYFVQLDTDDDDIITLYDGSSTSDPVLGSFSGSNVPADDIYSTGNQMLIVFEADGDGTTGNGFKVEYNTYQPTWCSGNTEVTAPSGSFDDGSGDFWYKNGSNCTWMIAPEWASDITLSFTEFHTEEDVDLVRVYDATNNQLLVTLSGEYTAGNLPDPIYNENGELFIVFQSNGGVNAPGWTVEWEIGNVGIDAENAEFNSLMVYPNPADNLLNVSFNLGDSQTFEVKLISVTGNVVYHEAKDNFSGHYVNTIDLSNMAKGVYFLNLTNETGSINKKVVVK